MVGSVHVVGAGRVGSAMSARLEERGIRVRLIGGTSRFPQAPSPGPLTRTGGSAAGVDLRADGADLVLLCVPDRAVADVARSVAPGPWIAHVSGATPLAALDPHEKRFGLHPLQTFTLARGAEQLDGAWAAITAETDEARALGHELAGTLGLRAFDLADERRVLYHAGASIASNFLVTLRRAAGELLEAAGAPPEALDPLMRRTIENGFELTGPIQRGDWDTVDAHLHAIRAEAPELEPLYRALAEATAA